MMERRIQVGEKVTFGWMDKDKFKKPKKKRETKK
jgi:hypothetical protein